MDLSWSINCISYAEPLLWLSIVLGSLAGSLAGAYVVRLLRRKPIEFVALIALPMLVAVPLALLLSFLFLATMYSAIRGGTVCVQFVRPAFIVPILLCGASIVRSAYLPPGRNRA